MVAHTCHPAGRRLRQEDQGLVKNLKPARPKDTEVQSSFMCLSLRFSGFLPSQHLTLSYTGLSSHCNSRMFGVRSHLWWGIPPQPVPQSAGPHAVMPVAPTCLDSAPSFWVYSRFSHQPSLCLLQVFLFSEFIQYKPSLGQICLPQIYQGPTMFQKVCLRYTGEFTPDLGGKQCVCSTCGKHAQRLCKDYLSPQF